MSTSTSASNAPTSPTSPTAAASGKSSSAMSIVESIPVSLPSHPSALFFDVTHHVRAVGVPSVDVWKLLMISRGDQLEA